MDIAAPTTPKSSTATATTVKTSDAKAISSDFEPFLKLLTTQISNQDPMDPMKAEEFAVQLATFSSVEQQVQTNELLSQMVTASDEFAALTSWIGREVKTDAALKFDGSSIEVVPEPAKRGEIHQLVVRSKSGQEVDRITLDGAGSSVEWDGMTANGAAPHGFYSFEVESFQNGELIATEAASGYARVTEVQRSEAGATLILKGGAKVSAAGITAVRDPA